MAAMKMCMMPKLNHHALAVHKRNAQEHGKHSGCGKLPCGRATLSGAYSLIFLCRTQDLHIEQNNWLVDAAVLKLHSRRCTCLEFHPIKVLPSPTCPPTLTQHGASYECHNPLTARLCMALLVASFVALFCHNRIWMRPMRWTRPTVMCTSGAFIHSSALQRTCAWRLYPTWHSITLLRLLYVTA